MSGNSISGAVHLFQQLKQVQTVPATGAEIFQTAALKNHTSQTKEQTFLDFPSPLLSSLPSERTKNQHNNRRKRPIARREEERKMVRRRRPNSERSAGWVEKGMGGGNFVKEERARGRRRRRRKTGREGGGVVVVMRGCKRR
ncbi:Os04g0648775, partial [Oryza sativa Japonica Group]